MKQIFLVVRYDNALPYGREVLGEFGMEGDANQFAESLLGGGDVRVLSRKPEVFQPSVKHIHRLSDLSCDPSLSAEKVEGGLRCYSEFWPYDRLGSGPDGRAMPGDVWLWAKLSQLRAAYGRLG
jgi:hypothetical protein